LAAQTHLQATGGNLVKYPDQDWTRGSPDSRSGDDGNYLLV